ncbi:hypothetical protein GUITHDRAFT_160284 [Guillardia theta CCMP2712]|uniref:DUF3641 domain-containing protein n=1 Tax=Guillardia theta (strain CCMP2712) TaxID=905079 RepID=L1IC20_GUITC|nr:hypothetical protein GUITHDRAFT_160284 [Guillardia theta CCMP2712]EKX33479.1 hypothetical protein GUITHDRAFT_160284 [Guillardia theta CCMP2712]|eukprot:XP_005820459.1 hypothetical protein GUITHDRAFT_160284 [Guillardia theta CCMP2712]
MVRGMPGACSARGIWRQGNQALRQCVLPFDSVSSTPLSARSPSLSRMFNVTPDFNTDVNVHQHRIELRKVREKKIEEIRGRTSASLIPDSMRHVEEDEDHKTTARNLKELGQQRLTMEERKNRRRALDNLGVPSFDKFLADRNVSLKKSEVEILQLNIGLYCNQACNHCHVESSPKRKEMMSKEVAKRCIELLDKSPSIKTIDLTGGAPELNDQFRFLVSEASARNKEIIDRCNLTVLTEPGQEDLVDFLVKHKVRVIASLPCYSLKNVDTQRGSGVFEKSIHGLMKLNQAGYGAEGSGLVLDLIYNPLGGFLPPEQKALEEKYKTELSTHFGIVFNSLFTLSNMPIKRFADFLYRRGELQEYMDLLVRNFNLATVDGLMCTNLVSVGYDGKMYDCDFNQQLALGMKVNKLSSPTVFDVQSLEELRGLAVVADSHCFGCTAGNGSSCQGATA